MSRTNCRVFTGTLAETFTGKIIDVTDIKESDIDWADIAHSLALTCRFSGHCRHFYSVAAHSLHCYREALRQGHEYKTAVAALLHDAAEAYWHDLGSPHKAAKGLSTYNRYLDKTQRVIYRAARLRVTKADLDIVKSIDVAVLKAEAAKLMTSGGKWWFDPNDNIAAANIPPAQWLGWIDPKKAEHDFLAAVRQWLEQDG